MGEKCKFSDYLKMDEIVLMLNENHLNKCKTSITSHFAARALVLQDSFGFKSLGSLFTA